MISLQNLIKLTTNTPKSFKNNYWLNYYRKGHTSAKTAFLLQIFTLKNTKVLSRSLFINISPFNLYFLKQELFYTKLKYSRVPQFDTSSGAAASFISGFYGFLVCEKFGFELLDSGDFLFIIVYLAFYFLLAILWVTILNSSSRLFEDFYSLLKSFIKI